MSNKKKTGLLFNLIFIFFCSNVIGQFSCPREINCNFLNGEWVLLNGKDSPFTGNTIIEIDLESNSYKEEVGSTNWFTNYQIQFSANDCSNLSLRIASGDLLKQIEITGLSQDFLTLKDESLSHHENCLFVRKQSPEINQIFSDYCTYMNCTGCSLYSSYQSCNCSPLSFGNQCLSNYDFLDKSGQEKIEDIIINADGSYATLQRRKSIGFNTEWIFYITKYSPNNQVLNEIEITEIKPTNATSYNRFGINQSSSILIDFITAHKYQFIKYDNEGLIIEEGSLESTKTIIEADVIDIDHIALHLETFISNSTSPVFTIYDVNTGITSPGIFQTNTDYNFDVRKFKVQKGKVLLGGHVYDNTNNFLGKYYIAEFNEEGILENYVINSSAYDNNYFNTITNLIDIKIMHDDSICNAFFW